MNIDVTMFQQAFFDESEELLNDLETQLLSLEERKHDRELLNTIFRCAHSIKGGSATFGFPEIAKFTHELETLLDLVRAGTVAVTADLCVVLFQSLDQMRALLAKAMDQTQTVPDDAALIARIVAFSGVQASKSPATPSPAAGPDRAQAEVEDEGVFGVWGDPFITYTLRFSPSAKILHSGCDPLHLLDQVAEIADVLEVRRSEEGIPLLKDLDPELCYLSWEIDLRTNRPSREILEVFEFLDETSVVSLLPLNTASEVSSDERVTEIDIATPIVKELTPDSTQAASALSLPSLSEPGPAEAHARTETATLRVSAEKVDRLVNLVGELIITQSMLDEVTQGFEMERLPRLLEAVAAMERASRELQERVMGIRLVQLKHALARFPRLVRDLSASIGKKIDLITVGEETELDKTLIEAIGDPLTHLVRNSIDHGLEAPDERRAAGKDETGFVRVDARYEGGNVTIEVSDDGRGLDRDRILAKARERGVLGESETATEEQIFGFIFHPGFSTAKVVTDLSGRGVGLDIVRQGIQALNGTISVSSQPGVGTKFRIRLPLTMAILEGLSLRIGAEVYILPLTSIIESIRPNREDLSLVAGQHEVVRVRGEVLAILRLHSAFGVETKIKDPCEGLLIIVENEGQKVALLVDELITQNQAVIKSLEANYQKVEGITGATILGDGRVALIIDVPGLLRGKHFHHGAQLAA